MRSGWTYNGKHFAETQTERGGLRYFIDGKPTTRQAWLVELNAAKDGAEQERREMIASAARANNYGYW
jgi:hypothetical protein